MTATREAVVLPCLFLTVVLGGAVQPGESLAIQPPSLFALILATLLVAVLVQSGAFDPRQVIDASRSGLANANGVGLFASLFLASAQVFSLMTPGSGLPRMVLGTYFLILMLNTIAAGPDRVRVLRSLAVTFGAAFVLKFVILDALSDPVEGRFGRAVRLLFEGVTLGAVTQEPQHPAAGYLAFVTAGLFLVAVWLLPGRAPDRVSQSGRMLSRHGTAIDVRRDSRSIYRRP